MPTISTHRARHSGSDTVAASIASGQPLTDADAAAIASYYQTPAGHGLTFAMLAQGSPVESADVLAAIAAELSTVTPARDNDGSEDYRAELGALEAWARSQA